MHSSPTRTITNIVVHHRRDFPTALDLTNWFRRRGFLRNGYHFCVDVDGTIVSTRPVDWAGAFSREQDAESIGVAIMASSAVDLPIVQQTAVDTLLSTLRQRYIVAGVS